MARRPGLLPLLGTDSDDDDDDNGEIASTFSSSALGVFVKVMAVVVAVVIDVGVVGINRGAVVALVAVIDAAAIPPFPTLLLRPAKLLRNESIILIYEYR